LDGIQLSKARCRALVISCSDFRFISAQRQIRLDLGLEHAYDLLARPGGVFSLVRSPARSVRRSMLDEIDMLRSLHRFREILLMNHVSCGAYRGLARGNAELRLHREDLLGAKAMLEERYPRLAISAYLSTIVEDRVEVIRVPQRAAPGPLQSRARTSRAVPAARAG
jgi:carbonic anhydrase